MPGWPTRISREGLGPYKANYLGVAGDPRVTENAEESNAIRWLLAGVAKMLPRVRALVLTGATTGDCVVASYDYAWDIDQRNPDLPYVAAAAPVITRTASGIFEVAFPALGTDDAGNSVPIVLEAARADAQTAARRAHAEVITPTSTVQITVDTDTTGAVSDAPTYVWIEAR